MMMITSIADIGAIQPQCSRATRDEVIISNRRIAFAVSPSTNTQHSYSSSRNRDKIQNRGSFREHRRTNFILTNDFAIIKLDSG